MAEVLNVAIVMALLLTLCLAVPLLTQGVTNTWYRANNQYLIGPMVNAALIYGAFRFKKGLNVVAIVLVPSICMATLGLLGVNAVFMMYMIPCLWLGNIAIVCAFRFLKRYSIAAVVGITAKVTCVFGGFLILRSFGVFPTAVAEQLFTMMGMVQIITATCGALLAYGAVKISAGRQLARQQGG